MNAASLRSIAPNYTADMDNATVVARAKWYADASHQPGRKLKSSALQAERLLFIAAVRGQQVAPAAAAAAPKAKQTAWVMVNGKAVELAVVEAPKVPELPLIWKDTAKLVFHFCPKGQFVQSPTGVVRFVNKGRLPLAVKQIIAATAAKVAS